MPLKPMLASALSDPNDLSSLRFPVFASPKLDGIRATFQDGRILSRTLKEIPNTNIHKIFGNLPKDVCDGMDGEFIVGDPTAKDAFRKTTSVVMSDDAPADGIFWHVFDRMGLSCFELRMGHLRGDFARHKIALKWPIRILDQKALWNVEDVLKYEEEQLAIGYEGVMLRNPAGPYKHGRATEKSQDLLKLKRFKDSEAVIIGFKEEMENQNEEFTNELGRTARSSAKGGKVAKGTMGALQVRDITTDVEFEIGTGFDAELRANLWKVRDKLAGKIVKYSYFPSGSKDKPRFPVFLGFRDKRDM